MDRNLQKSTIGYALIILATMLWGIAGPLAKHLFQIGILPTDLVQARVTYSFFILVMILGLFRRDLLKIDRKDIVYFLILGIGGFALVQWTYFFAINHLDVGIAIAIQYTAPTLIVIYSALFLGKKIDVKTILSVGLALIGCYLVIGAYEAEWEDLNWVGILGAFSSAIVFAFYTLYSERGLAKYDAWTVFFYAVLFATIFWNIVHPPLVLMGQNLSWNTWGMVMAVAIIGTLIPFALFFMALKRLDPIRLTVTSTLEPIFATMIAFFTLGEALSPLQISGGLFIIISVILMATANK